MKANTEIKNQVLATLERFNAAVAGRGLHASLSFFVKDADVCLIGSEAGEVAVGHCELEEFFRQVHGRPV